MASRSHFTSVVRELGLLSIWNSPLDVKLLCIQRFVRLFAYGATTLVLVLYLSELGISDQQIGVFMTLTLFGDVFISLFLTMFADRIGRKDVLALGAVMMTGSGIAFGLSSNYWVLLAAAIFGVISPSGKEVGPFRAIEESTLAHLTEKEVRADIFAWYTLIGTGGYAFGILVCGWMVEVLKALDGWDDIRAYRVIFFAYSVFGLMKLLLVLALSKDCEAKPKPPQERPHEEAPLLGAAEPSQPRRSFFGVFSHISPESLAVLLQLCLLFGLDSFASGLIPLSWVTVFFQRKFGITDGFLGTIFFTTNIIAALSTLGAASLARRIGNVRTMVFTHLPSAIFVAVIAIPSQMPVALTFLILRSCTQSMDVAPRSAFLAATILPNERTAIMGILNVVKTFTSGLGPGLTGVLFDHNLAWTVFVMAGSLKVIYDLGMLAVFKGHESREDKPVRPADEET
ncbi:hypothetical protein VC83_03253 [Pseudogymnoascus destructans]|uniref:Major facilitator superfamily (MFS) profile domain-containing protein n=2 Tax=Pseudogymnoascus destructans TaxID=655981 RepID=L8FYC3_PSED2|nr:uncharacterized protein VC83_03253 [Pseudogymnoascus destructans]ELR06010.1 hypothetical protein GMDG_07721 [Pseudogymnoascus destructans 20631-21]OAF60590.1 hypothetical protein VC83_03253 [Pseudogymnoascus destructans]